MVIGMMLLADRHDVISQYLHLPCNEHERQSWQQGVTTYPLVVTFCTCSSVISVSVEGKANASPSLCFCYFVFSKLLPESSTPTGSSYVAVARYAPVLSRAGRPMKKNLPSYEAMMPVVLKVLADGAARSLREVFERVFQYYAFTPEQLADT